MKQKQLNHRRSFFRNLSPLLFRQLWWVKRIFLESRQSNSPVINRIITSLVHELPPRSVDDTKTTENHFVVISLTDESEATSVEKKVDMKDAPLVGKLGSTEKPKFLKAWVKWNLMYKVFFSENHLRAHFTKFTKADWILTKKFLNIALPRRSRGL